MTQTCIRATDLAMQGTTQFADAILAYATSSTTIEIRLAITKRYVEGDNLPDRGPDLINNSPMLYAVAAVGSMPGITGGQLFVVLDAPGLTRRRVHRESEIRSLLAALNKKAFGKVKYTTQPIEATNAMTPEDAVKTIYAADYTDLTPDTEADVLRRLA